MLTLRAAFGALGLSLAPALGMQPSAVAGAAAGRPVETLRSVAALPAHVAGTFEEIAACHLSPEGDYLVFDRRAHAVSLVPRSGPARRIVQIGVEPGRILRPVAFDSAPDGTFTIADAPYQVERVQVFFYAGGSVGGFTLPGRWRPRVALGNLVLSGVGSLEYTGTSILVSQPESGSLVTEYGLDGKVLRSFGELRRTGHEADADVHLALNAGMPVAIPGTKGVYYVFLSGVPMFRKYDATGTLVFERHVEGREIDEHIRALPGAWPKRRTAEGEFALVPPSIRTAAADRDGNLWLSLVHPFTYVYDADGDKRRTVQFRAAGTLSPLDLFFTRDGRILASPGCYTFDPRQDQ